MLLTCLSRKPITAIFANAIHGGHHGHLDHVVVWRQLGYPKRNLQWQFAGGSWAIRASLWVPDGAAAVPRITYKYTMRANSYHFFF